MSDATKVPSAGTSSVTQEDGTPTGPPPKKLKTEIPKTGHVPIITMTIYWDDQLAQIKVLLDSESTIPLLFLSWTEFQLGS